MTNASLTELQAKEVLDFLGKKVGYDKSKIILHDNYLKQLHLAATIKYYTSNEYVNSYLWFKDNSCCWKYIDIDLEGDKADYGKNRHLVVLENILDMCKTQDIYIEIPYADTEFKYSFCYHLFLKRGTTLEKILVEMDLEKAGEDA